MQGSAAASSNPPARAPAAALSAARVDHQWYTPSISNEDAVSIFRARLNGAGDDTAGLLATQYGITAASVHRIWARELCKEATCHL